MTFNQQYIAIAQDESLVTSSRPDFFYFGEVKLIAQHVCNAQIGHPCGSNSPRCVNSESILDI